LQLLRPVGRVSRRRGIGSLGGMGVSPQVLNEAMCVYVHTFPTRDRLSEHITKHGLEGQRDKIVTELDAVLKTAEEHLYSYPGGVPWTKSFEHDYRELLLQRHPWLNAKSLNRVFGFSGWLCWHDGLNAKGV
jgi:hypothetical protein